MARKLQGFHFHAMGRSVSSVFPLRSPRALLPTRHALLTTTAARGAIAVSLMSNATKDETFVSSRHFPPQTSNASHYYIAAIILFGFVGNVLCAVACRHCNPLRRSRFSHYLIACAISDTVFLLCLGLVWLKGVGVNWHDLSAVCTVSAFASNTSSFLSAW